MFMLSRFVYPLATRVSLVSLLLCHKIQDLQLNSKVERIIFCPSGDCKAMLGKSLSFTWLVQHLAACSRGIGMAILPNYRLMYRQCSLICPAGGKKGGLKAIP